jgi:hypothetical protein
LATAWNFYNVKRFYNTKECYTVRECYNVNFATAGNFYNARRFYTAKEGYIVTADITRVSSHFIETRPRLFSRGGGGSTEGVTLSLLWNSSPVPYKIQRPLWGFEYPACDQCDVIRERKKGKLLTQKGTQDISSHAGNPTPLIGQFSVSTFKPFLI